MAKMNVVNAQMVCIDNQIGVVTIRVTGLGVSNSLRRPQLQKVWIRSADDSIGIHGSLIYTAKNFLRTCVFRSSSVLP